MKFWIETTETDEKQIITLKNSALIFIFTLGVSFGLLISLGTVITDFIMFKGC